MKTKPASELVLLGVFEGDAAAEHAIHRAVSLGIDPEEVSIVAHPYAVEDERKQAVMRAVEPRTGAVFGPAALFATIVGIGLWAVPLGPLLVAGPIAWIGAGAAAFGTPIFSPDRFTDLGVPRDDAKLAIEAVRRGGIVVVARVPARKAREIAEVFDRSGAIDLFDRARQWESEGWVYEPNAPLWSTEEIERERTLRHPVHAIPRTSAPSYA